MALNAATYYALRELSSSSPQRHLFHRRISLPGEAIAWTQSGLRRAMTWKRAQRRVSRIISEIPGRYFVIPLQVPSDSNLQGAACGWTSAALVRSSIVSFSRSADPDHHLLFKIHPLARGYARIMQAVRDEAERCGVGSRVHVIEAGSMDRISAQARGMITINSTSGFSAISAGIPLLVLGKAIYGHPSLVTKDGSRTDMDRFWRDARSAPLDLRERYLDWIAHRSLVFGDFYSRKGMHIAISGITDKISRIGS